VDGTDIRFTLIIGVDDNEMDKLAEDTKKTGNAIYAAKRETKDSCNIWS
jgi:hypothetical protein